MKKILVTAGLVLICGIVVVKFLMPAAHHGGHGDGPANHGGSMHSASAGMPVEAGQSAFAATAEIVQMLQRNDATDWSKVDITTLRNHLVDMNALMMNTSVTHEMVDGGMKATIRGAPEVLAAVGRMVPAHSQMLKSSHAFTLSFDGQSDKATWVVTTDDEAQVDQIRGLGFYGLMATGSHHQPHHFAVATGNPMH